MQLSKRLQTNHFALCSIQLMSNLVCPTCCQRDRQLFCLQMKKRLGLFPKVLCKLFMFLSSYVAKIFFLTLKEVFSKCGSSVASGNESANFRNVSIDTICQAIFLLVSNVSTHKATSRFLFYKRP